MTALTCHLITVGAHACGTAKDERRHRVDFQFVLVNHQRAARRARVGPEDDSISTAHADDRRASLAQHCVPIQMGKQTTAFAAFAAAFAAAFVVATAAAAAAAAAAAGGGGGGGSAGDGVGGTCTAKTIAAVANRAKGG